MGQSLCTGCHRHNIGNIMAGLCSGMASKQWVPGCIVRPDADHNIMAGQ